MKATILMITAATLLLSACKVQKSPDEATTPPATQEQPATAPPGEDKPIPGAVAKFDINAQPVSSIALGEFPFMSLPDGYVAEGGETLDYARFPFWYNNASNWVEGKFFQARLKPQPGKSASWFELKKNFEAVIQQMGGVQVADAKLPYDVTKSWGSEITSGFYTGLGGGYEPQTVIWVVPHKDGNVWVQLAESSKGAGYVVGQEKGFVQTAKLLPAAALKQQLDSVGKVSLQVNFATDKTEILPDSLPQIDQVVQLLKNDPALKLAVNGHTDNTGQTAHNQTLSEGRAKSVVAAVAAKGIDAARLAAKGFGDTQPVADNGTEQGKAQNRRVELVKQ